MRHLVEIIPSDAFSITPSDSTLIKAIGFYVGVGGDVAVVTEGGSTVTHVGAAAGAYYPLQITKVLLTGTTATSILGYRP